MVDDAELITGGPADAGGDGTPSSDDRQPRAETGEAIWRSMDLPGMDGDGDVAVALADR